MTIQLKNNATGFLSAGISATATLLVLQSGEGANFPALVPSQFFYVTLISTSGAIEVVKVTGRSGDSLTIQRAQEGTTAMSFAALSRVELRVTAQAVYDVIDAAISGTTTAVSNIASVIAVAASIDSVNTVTSNLASVINVSNNIGDINLVENSLTNVNAVAANMADVNAIADDLAAVNAVADDIDDLVTNLEDIVAVGGSINSVVTVANNIASVNAVNSNSTNVNTVAGSIGNVNTVATNIAAVQTVSTNIASVNAVNSNSANVNTVAGSIANVNTTATNIASVNTAATNIAAIQTAPAQAAAAASSASAAATSATNAAASATAAAASAVTAVNAPGTSGTSTTSLTIGTGSQTFTTQTGKAWVVGQFVTVASTASPTNFMHGQITAYNSGTGSMTVNVLSVGGSGTLASWTIGLVGPNATLTDQNSLQPVALTLPSVRPSLLLDFANSKKLDPRITFTRATSATYYDGVTSAKAEENLLLNSVGPLNSGWSLANGYAGTQGAELLLNSTSWTGASGVTRPDDWTAPLSSVDSTYTVAGGVLTITNGTGGSRTVLRQAISVTPGAYYQVTVKDLSNGTSGPGSASVRIVDTDSTSDVTPLAFGSVAGTQYASFIATTSTIYVFLGNYAFTNGAYISVDDISIKQLTADNVTAPDGTSTAVTATADAANATFTQSVTAIAAEYTFSVYLRRVTGTGDIDIQCGGGTWVTQAITSSWARYTVTQTLTAGTRTPGIRIVTSGDQIEVWGAQLEQRSAATAYTPTTTQPITNYVPQLLTAPAGVPRFDHNPTTGESLGLLVEEQRTNLLTYSQDINSTNYNNGWGGGTFVVNSTVAPDGSVTATKLVPNAGATETWWGKYERQTISVTAGQSYTLSCYLKAAGFSTVLLTGDLRDAGGLALDATFTLSGNGTAVGVGSTQASIIHVGNGWYRCIATAVAGTTTLEEPGITWSGSGADGFKGFFAWGFQMEAGAFPTSYIPTTSASVTRTADDARMTGVNFSSWYRQDRGTVYVESESSYIKHASSNYPAFLNNSLGMGVAFARDSASSGSPQWSLRAGTRGNNTIDADLDLFNGGGTNEGVNIINTVTTRMVNKMVGAVQIGTGFSVSYFGLVGEAAELVNSGSTSYRVANMMHIGGGFYSPFLGTIKKIAYYPARLTNAQLQALTA